MKKMVDYTGQRFGKLVVLRPTQERKHGSVVWECVCDCGNMTNVTAFCLKGGKTKSCGCLRKGNKSETKKGTLKEDIDKLTVGDICRKYGISPAELEKRFSIPLRTVQAWLSGERTPPAYVVTMLARILELEDTPNKYNSK